MTGNTESHEREPRPGYYGKLYSPELGDFLGCGTVHLMRSDEGLTTTPLEGDGTVRYLFDDPEEFRSVSEAIAAAEENNFRYGIS